MIGAISWTRAGLAFIAEMLGAVCASAVVAALLPGTLNVSTTLNSSTSSARGLCKHNLPRGIACRTNDT